MSQPPTASTDGMPSTYAKNVRTFSGSEENTIACIPVITARAYCFGPEDEISRRISSRYHELALPEAPGTAHRGRWAGIPELAAGACPGPPADGERDRGRYRERPAAEPEHGGHGQRGR